MAVGHQPPRLRCVSLNLFHGGLSSVLRDAPQDVHRRLAFVAAELQRLQVDLIGLQEASTSKGRGSVVAHLAARLGFYAVYAPASCRLFPSPRLQQLVARAMNFTEGPALVSRFPFLAWDIH